MTEFAIFQQSCNMPDRVSSLFSINCGLLLFISLMLFFHENEDWEDLPFFWKNLQADVLHSLLNFAAETTTNSFGSFNATQNTPYIILTKK